MGLLRRRAAQSGVMDHCPFLTSDLPCLRALKDSCDISFRRTFINPRRQECSVQNAECRVQTQHNNGPHERATLMFARIIFEVVVVCPTCMICGRWSCCHLNPTLSTNRQKGSKTASAMIASPAPTGKSWTTRSQPSKRIRSLSTLVVTEAASGLQPCVKIDSSKLVMLTQLDVFKAGRGRRPSYSSEEICVHLPCLCLSLSFFREILSSRFLSYSLARSLRYVPLVTRFRSAVPFPQGSSLSFPGWGQGQGVHPSHLFSGPGQLLSTGTLLAIH